MDKIRNVRLYGWLGTKYGRLHRFAVNSPAEAVRALASQFKGFEKDLLESKSKGCAFSVFLGKKNIGEPDLLMPPGAEDIRIAPVILGSKRGGLFQVLLGAALIAGAAFYSGGLAAAFTAKGFVGTTAILGASLAFGGIVQLLSPQQGGLSVKDSPDNGANYNFNGPVNTQAQGNPVPVLYGRMIVGGAVISAGIYAEDQA